MAAKAEALVTLPQTAHRLQESYEKTKRLLFIGELEGEQIGGRWLVREDSIERVLRQRAEARLL